MLNNYPIRVFDNLIDSKKESYLKNQTYRGLKFKNSFVVAGNPFFAEQNCNCLLGFRLQSFSSKNTVEKEDIFPKNKWVIIQYLQSLYSTILYPSEKGQIRSQEDQLRTVELSASISKNDSPVIFNYYKREAGIKSEVNENEEEVYTIPVSDFTSPVIEVKRYRPGHAGLKEILMIRAGKAFEDFLDN